MRLYIYMYEQICLEQWLQQLLSSPRRIVRLVQHVALATQRLGIHKYAYMCIYIYIYICIYKQEIHVKVYIQMYAHINTY